MKFLLVEELEFVSRLFLVNDLAEARSHVDGVDLRIELNDLVCLALAAFLVFLNPVVQVSLALLSLNLLAHSKNCTRLVEGLIGRDGHLDLVPDSEEEKASFGLTQTHLTDNLIKALREELFSYRADAALASLPLHQLLIELLSQTGHVDSGRLLVAHVLYVVLAVFDPFSRGQNRV